MQGNQTQLYTCSSDIHTVLRKADCTERQPESSPLNHGSSCNGRMKRQDFKTKPSNFWQHHALSCTVCLVVSCSPDSIHWSKATTALLHGT